MASKRILCEQRLRHIPAQFSWIDQRLVFEGHLRRCDAQAATLYLFLLTVADAQGLSYWGDARVMGMLSTTNARLDRARAALPMSARCTKCWRWTGRRRHHRQRQRPSRASRHPPSITRPSAPGLRRCARAWWARDDRLRDLLPHPSGCGTAP
ncbi:MAG TPA: hypothetical protein VF319_00380 [Caldimonas sp.]